MSVLTDLSISYESLPGEPSFFITTQQATPVRQEIAQSPLSMPYISESPKARVTSSNFDISPSIATRHTIKRHPTHRTQLTNKPATTVHKQPQVVDEFKQSAMAKAVTPARTTARASRGMFNEFERATLLSYMQRRQYS